MRRIADDGLVEVANLDGDLALRIGDGPEIAEVTVAAVQMGGPSGIECCDCSSHW